MDEISGSSDAEELIGMDDDSRDWDLKPEQHVGQLGERAGALRRVLQRQNISQIMARYRQHDGDAVAQQNYYKKARRKLVVGAYLAAFFGLLALSMHLVKGFQSDFQFVLVLVHLCALVFVIVTAVLINRRNPRKKWLEERGKAELLRIALFVKVTQAEESVVAGREAELLPLQLAYFRRYQLDVQLSYLKGRGKQLERTAGMPAWYTGLALLVALVAFILAGLSIVDLLNEHGILGVNLVSSPQTIEQVAYWGFLLLGVTTIYAVLVTHQDVSEDQRNAARYLAQYNNLKFLKDQAYKRVRQAAEKEDRETVERFITIIHEQIAAEQNEWVSLQSMVDNEDLVLASTTTKGLRELFADRFQRAEADVQSQ